MKAAVHSKYGLTGNLKIMELDVPVPKAGEVVIRVHATTVNRTDCHVLSGRPFLMRIFTGLLKPRRTVIGSDFSGEIEAVGPGVQSFKAGQKIMGFGGVFGCGSHAQYFIMDEAKAVKSITNLPQNLSYEEAAACLEGTFYAASVMIQLKPRAGQKALVNGATGAIGSAYVQLLKYYGVYVTAVCAGKNAGLVTSWGADKVVDYTTDDFTKDNEKYDFVLDAVGKSSFVKCRPLLKKKGIYTSSGGAINLFWVLITPLLGGKKVPFIPPKHVREGLNFIKDLVENGNFKPVIDRKYPLEKISEAFTYVASGQKIGNVVITMDA